MKLAKFIFVHLYKFCDEIRSIETHVFEFQRFNVVVFEKNRLLELILENVDLDC